VKSEKKLTCNNCIYCYWEDLDGKLDCEKGVKHIYGFDDNFEFDANDDICEHFERRR
jgi:hypothetical protein